jgi:hypothetical protein
MSSGKALHEEHAGLLIADMTVEVVSGVTVTTAGQHDGNHTPLRVIILPIAS